MLSELAVTDLGVIAESSLLLGPGMTALTGETGAGKTLVVTAIELLLGGRGDPGVVRPGAGEARVEGRFVDDEGVEVVLARAVPAEGRSRAYVDGRLAPATVLAERGAPLVDLHGQNAHQALLAPAAQRRALDAFGSVDLGPLRQARAEVGAIDAELDRLGGDERARARELDLLDYQLGELDEAGLEDPDEDVALSAEEDALSGADAARAGAAAAHDALLGDGGVGDAVGVALAALAGRAPLAELEVRLRAVAAEVTEAGLDLRALGEGLEDDPERLDAIRRRRGRLRELRRKYGADLADVIAFREEIRRQCQELRASDARVQALGVERDVALDAVRRAESAVGRDRRRCAPDLARRVEGSLRELAMPRATFQVHVGDDDPGDDVVFLLGANAGEPALPLTKVASGGELARTMLALRLALNSDRAKPGRTSAASGGRIVATAVFDEVDAGVGGEAALSVGRALAAVAEHTQVLVVTHLAQVAAYADAQVRVAKVERKGRTVASIEALGDDERIVELSRMLSGSPDSARARDHARELLAAAQGRDVP